MPVRFESTVEEDLDKAAITRIKSSTKLTEDQIWEKHDAFARQFPMKGISQDSFRRLSRKILQDDDEVDEFTERVYKMFDADKNRFLTFEEFTVATEQPKDNPLYKLDWIFDNIFDVVRPKKGTFFKGTTRNLLKT